MGSIIEERREAFKRLRVTCSTIVNLTTEVSATK